MNPIRRSTISATFPTMADQSGPTLTIDLSDTAPTCFEDPVKLVLIQCQGNSEPDTITNDAENTLIDAQIEEFEQRGILELLAYLDFKSGWDGYDGSPFLAKTIERAITTFQDLAKFLRKTKTTPAEFCPGPASDGSVHIELTINNTNLILSIRDDSDEVSYFAEKDSQESNGSLKIGGTNLVDELSGVVC